MRPAEATRGAEIRSWLEESEEAFMEILTP
jgi:hypothetical protein